MSAPRPFPDIMNDIGEELPTPKTLFNEIKTAKRVPVVQIKSHTGFRDDVQGIFQGVGSNADVVDYKYTASSGTDPFGISSINTFLKGSYKSGQAVECGGTFKFDNPTGACLQIFGFTTAEDLIAFAKLNDEFGVLVSTFNSTEIQTLTITTGASSAGDATITVNGVPYTVPLTASNDAATTASEIGSYFRNSPAPNYTVTANGVDVIALSGAPVPAGAFVFDAGVTGAGASWAQNRAGALPDYPSDFIPASEWPAAPVWLSELDTAKFNVGTIELGYYGAKGIRFSLDNPKTGAPEEVYFYEYLNKNDMPIVLNPSLSVGWAVQNLGNTTNVEVQGNSAAIFNHGDVFIDEPPRTARGEQTTVAGNIGQEVNILSIRNRSVYGGTINAVDIYSIVLSVRNESNKDGLIVIRKNPTYDRAVRWDYKDQVNSVAEISTDFAIITDGEDQFSLDVLKEAVSGLVELERFIGKLTPRNVISIGWVPSAAGAIKASFNWKEDQ